LRKTASDRENPEIGDSRQSFCDMKQTKVAKYAYAAGLIDGDGSIVACRVNRNDGRKNSYAISVEVCMSDGRPIDFLFGTFGGSVRQRNYKNTNFKATKFSQYHWYLKASKAKAFLKKILPFLRLKRRQAELAIRLQTRIEAGKRKRKKGFRTGFEGWSEHEVKIRDSIIEQLKQENHRHHKSLALETKRSRGSQDPKAIVQPPENQESGDS